MLNILHASDLHFGRHFIPERAEDLLRSIERASPDLLVFSGDFTQRAKRREYAEARAFLDRLPDLPLVVTPGNHDVPVYRVFERLFSPMRNYREFISEELDGVLETPAATVVHLNSTAPLRKVVEGVLTTAQLDLARRAFAASPPGKVRILVTHHHLVSAPDYERDHPISGAREALDVLQGAGVELVLGGHLHRAFIANSLDVYAGEDREHGIVLVHSGTTTSARGRAREREKNTLNLLRVGESTIEVVHHMYFDAARAFVAFSAHTFPRRPARWLGGAKGAAVEGPAPAAAMMTGTQEGG